jgi:hydrogenase maturation protein HypF
LFDAAAAIVLDVPGTSFEAQGPMLLESLCERRRAPVELPITPDEDGVLRSDWAALLPVLADESLSRRERAEVFHSSVATAILRQAIAVREQHEFNQVGLCGGVFQNRVLGEEVLALLRDAGFHVCMPKQLPCNDAALSFGQAAEMAARSAGA